MMTLASNLQFIMMMIMMEIMIMGMMMGNLLRLPVKIIFILKNSIISCYVVVSLELLRFLSVCWKSKVFGFIYFIK